MLCSAAEVGTDAVGKTGHWSGNALFRPERPGSLSLALGFSLHNMTDGYREATERSITQSAKSAESEASA